MKTVTWTDDSGYKHRAVIRDVDTLEQAKLGMGMPMDPPDVERINWSAVKRDLHNLLLLHGITNWEAIKRDNRFFASAMIKALKRHVIAVFKEDAR